jgi:hypothetical protein
MLAVNLGNWIRGLFSSSRIEDEAAEREEYGFRDRGEAELERDRAGSFPVSEAAQAAEEELDELKPPSDPAP